MKRPGSDPALSKRSTQGDLFFFPSISLLVALLIDGGPQSEIELLFHGDLSSKKGSFFGRKTCSHNISPHPSCSRDLNSSGGDIPFDGTSNDDRCRTDVVTCHPSLLSNYDEASQADITIECTIDSNTTCAGE